MADNAKDLLQQAQEIQRQKLLEQAQAIQQAKLNPEPPPMSMGDTAKVKFEEGTTLGLRPVVAGAGAALGDLYSQVTDPNGPRLDFGSAKNAFVEGRSAANAEQEKASKDHPYVSAAASLAGSALPSMFLPGIGSAGKAAVTGGALGAAHAAGSANTLGGAATDVGLGAVLGAGGQTLMDAAPQAGRAILDSNMASAVISKAEHVFGKTNNPITQHIVSALEDYKNQFQFPKESIVEKQLNDLISRVGKTPPSQLTDTEIEGITQRVGPGVFHDAVNNGAQRLADIGNLISSKASNALSGAVDKYGPAAKQMATVAGAALGARHGGGDLGQVILGGGAGNLATSPELYNLVGKAVSGSATLAKSLADTFGISPLTKEGLTKILQTPEAKDIILGHILKRDEPAMSTTIRSNIGRK